MTDRFDEAGPGDAWGPVTHHLRTVEAAQLLGVTPNTLRRWNERFRFPSSYRAERGSRAFSVSEVIALRAALRSGHSVATAIALARRTEPGFVALRLSAG